MSFRRPRSAGESVHANEAGDGERVGVALLCAIWTSSTQIDDKEGDEGEEKELLIEVKWISRPKEERVSRGRRV